MTVAEQFAAHAIDTRFADLPADTRQRAAIYVLDSLGVGIAGSSVEGARELLRVASGWGTACGASSGVRQRLADAQSGIRLPA
jgi:2-methylcitrate dehydratase PrpD